MFEKIKYKLAKTKCSDSNSLPLGLKFPSMASAHNYHLFDKDKFNHRRANPDLQTLNR